MGAGPAPMAPRRRADARKAGIGLVALSRSSEGTVSIARSSVAELGSWYEMLGALGFIDDARLALVVDMCDHMGRSLSRLIARLAGGT